MVAFSVLFAGISVGHAAILHSEGSVNAVHGVPTAHQQDMVVTSASDQKVDCQASAKGAGETGNSKHKSTDGCCHIACFPSVAPQDVLDLSKHVFNAKRFLSPFDETAASADPEGRLRPPRVSA
tara:strand:- start:17 stop:388 length:372 start_codon:yes stop_codon:yes gene_type:complete